MHSQARGARRLRRPLIALLIGGYLAAHAGFFLLFTTGDAARFKTSYFFTWDMFPNHYTQSVRRVAVGRTRSGAYLVLHPSAGQRFRGGVRGDMTRVDLDRAGSHFRNVVEHVRRATESLHQADPIDHVYLFEQYWPVKFNFSDRDYAQWMGQPKPWLADALDQATWAARQEAPWPPPRATWRLRAEYAVDGAPGMTP